MDQGLLDLLKNLPNLAVAIVALWWSSRVIEKMLMHQHQLIDRLLEIARQQAVIADKLNGAKHQSES